MHCEQTLAAALAVAGDCFAFAMASQSMDVDLITQELNKMKRVARDHPRVSPEVMKPLSAFLEMVERFVAFHNDKTTIAQAEIESAKNSIDALSSVNTMVQTSMEKIEEKLMSNVTQPAKETYSNVAGRHSKPKLEKTAVLIKAKVANLSPAQVKTMICNSLNPSEFNPLGMIVSKFNVAVELRKETDAKKLIDLIRGHENLRDSVEAWVPNPRCPNIIVRNVDYTTTETDLIDTIINRNNLDIPANGLKVLYTIKRKFYYDAVICTSPDAFDVLKSLDTPILTGWTGSWFEETILTGHCGRCFSLSHRTKDCSMNKDKKKCHHCLNVFSTNRSGNVQSPFNLHIRNCNSSNLAPKCTNCCSHDRYSNAADHYSISSDCPLYRARYQSVINLTCYDPSKKVSFRSRNSQNNDDNLSPTDQTAASSQSNQNRI